MIDKYCFISYEAILALGTSLDLDDMLKTFFKVIVKKTHATSALVLNKKDLSNIIEINKNNSNFNLDELDIDTSKQYCDIKIIDNKYNAIVLVLNDIVCLIKYHNITKDLQQLVKMFSDLTDKINSSVEACIAFNEYKKTKDRLELAIQGTNDGLWDWDIVNNEVYFSTKWKKMLGYEDYEIKNNFDEWKQRVHPQDIDKVLKTLNDYLSGKSNYYEIVHRVKHKNNSWIWILSRGKADFIGNTPTRMVGFHTDISKQKDLEAKLELKVIEEVQKNQVKDSMLRQQSRLAQMGELISMIAHQWRQPLASISAVTIGLKLKLALGGFDLSNKKGMDEFITYTNKELEDIEDLVDVLTVTIDDFRNFYKSDKEGINANINQPVQKALSIIKPQIDVDNITVIEQYKSKVQFNIFENELVQVFLNIIKNSIDNFKERNIENRTISISTEDILDKVIVSICDNGGGIEEEIMGLIFEPYFSTKNEKNGTGLGLYMSKSIVEQHHKGNLNVKNKGDGACFYVVLEHK